MRPSVISIPFFSTPVPDISWLREPRVCPSRANWDRFNQRQIRKNRRRAHAAGKRNAFL